MDETFVAEQISRHNLETRRVNCQRETPCSATGGKNRYGVDVAYFRKEFSKLARDLDNYTPMELCRYLERLSDVISE